MTVKFEKSLSTVKLEIQSKQVLMKKYRYKLMEIQDLFNKNTS